MDDGAPIYDPRWLHGGVERQSERIDALSADLEKAVQRGDDLEATLRCALQGVANALSRVERLEKIVAQLINLQDQAE